jgi:hypothetical protein
MNPCLGCLFYVPCTQCEYRVQCSDPDYTMCQLQPCADCDIYAPGGGKWTAKS